MTEQLSKKVVLAIEDERPLLQIYKIMLEKYGIHTFIAEDGEQGLDLVKKESPDFVILDIRMPKMDGIEVLRQMRADPKYKDIPVLILTNYNLEEYRSAVKDLNVLDFLVKSDVEIKNVVKAVKEFLEKNQWSRF